MQQLSVVKSEGGGEEGGEHCKYLVVSSLFPLKKVIIQSLL